MEGKCMAKILIDIRRVDFNNSVKANVEVTLILEEGDLTMKGFKVIHQEGKKPWVALPTTSYKDQTGEYKNFKIVEMSRRLYEQISKAILDQYQSPP
jgi:DNA-binding cell septation regulator SpoVG